MTTSSFARQRYFPRSPKSRKPHSRTPLPSKAHAIISLLLLANTHASYRLSAEENMAPEKAEGCARSIALMKIKKDCKRSKMSPLELMSKNPGRLMQGERYATMD